MDDIGVSIPEFVIQEAKERCFEIEVVSQKQHEAEKEVILQRERDKVKEDYEIKRKKNE